MSDHHSPETLRKFSPSHGYFIGIDSDGCAFDSMEIKHKECFAPNFIKHFGLQPVSKYAREVWEFVNLYSKSRGTNRFFAVEESIKLLGRRPEVLRRNVVLPDVTPLVEWTSVETKLSQKTIKAYLEKSPNSFLQTCFEWGEAVNATVEDLVKGVPPFPLLRESLEIGQNKADIMVVSSTPCEALDREWEEHDIAKYAEIICGQEMGSKKEHLAIAAKPNYAADHILMIGDAPGDLKAAKANGALFFPILPGREEESWERFHNEGLLKFFDGAFQGDYEKALLDEFDKTLPTEPSWQQVEATATA